MTQRYQDRQGAGEALARALAGGPAANLEELLVMGIPRGGVVVAAEVARALGAPLDVIVPRKLAAPERPEVAVGAVIDGDLPPFVDEELARLTGATPAYLDAEIARGRGEIARRRQLYRGGAPAPPVTGRSVLLVDDGIATGYTFRIALQSLRRQGPRHLIAAVPVAPEESLTWLQELADTVLCLQTPDPFLTVGVWYEAFEQTSDAEVMTLLRANRARLAGEPVEEEPAIEQNPWERAVAIPAGEVVLDGELGVPPGARGVVLFAHGSGSGRHSRRNRFVAHALQQAGLATLLFDLLTPEETRDRRNVFDIDLLADRLLAAREWVRQEVATKKLPLGYFGASTGAAAALQTAARAPEGVTAIVSRGGRPDLAAAHLARVTAPTLLLVGGEDGPVIGMNEGAARQMRCLRETAIIPGAGHMFEEPGTLEEVARLAQDWFQRHLAP